jgi:hypothetical protein
MTNVAVTADDEELPSFEQLRRMEATEIDHLVTKYPDNLEFLERVKQRCELGTTSAARELHARVDGLIALVEERRFNEKTKTNWTWIGMLFVVLTALGIGIVQGAGQQFWHAVIRPVLGQS